MDRTVAVGAVDLDPRVERLPRLRAEYDRLMTDPGLKAWHARGLDWHHTKARELHATPEFEDLYRQAVALRLVVDQVVHT